MTDAIDLGQRIASVRHEAGLTQHQCAERVGLNRSSLAKIELGQRRVSALELSNIAQVLKYRVEWFFLDAPQSVVSHRAELKRAVTSIDREIERLAREVEFVAAHSRLLALRSPEPLSFPDDRDGIEQSAEATRRLLGLEPRAAADDLARRCGEIGLLAFSLDLGSEAADGASLLLAKGGIALVNGSQPVGRRRLTLAHELGHFMFADEYSVDRNVTDASADAREVSIDHFARAILLPPSPTRTRWRELEASQPDIRSAAVIAASEFQVDMATLARRLVEIEAANSTTAKLVRTASTGRFDFVEFDLSNPDELAPPCLPRQYEAAVLNLFRREQISRPRALGLLFDSWQDDELPALPDLPAEALASFLA